MFGYIAAGRPVQTDLTAVSPTQFTFTLPTSPTLALNHIVIFLLPNNSLPLSTAATVYIQLSPAKPFQLLGALTNEKPSAIFRVKNLPTNDQDEMLDDSSTGMNGDSTSTPSPTSGEMTIVTFGISIEPIETVQAALAAAGVGTGAGNGAAVMSRALTPAPKVPSLPPTTTLTIARSIIKNAFNYLSSFAVKVQVPGQGMVDVIPLRSFQDWWTKFEKKVELDPGFLERED